MKQVIIVEDDRNLNQGLCLALKDQDLQIVPCFDLKSAREQLADGTAELVLLDINLPDGSGLELLREIKTGSEPIPVILLTANDTEMDVVMGLEHGTDDYITKPFSLAILRARVKAQLRRDLARVSKPSVIDEKYLACLREQVRTAFQERVTSLWVNSVRSSRKYPKNTRVSNLFMAKESGIGGTARTGETSGMAYPMGRL
jgi:DNA-binding response OmpR family regulator